MEFLQIQFDQLNNFYDKILPFLPDAISGIKRNNFNIQNNVEEIKTILININGALENKKTFNSAQELHSTLSALNDYALNLIGEMNKEHNSLLEVNNFLTSSNLAIASLNEEITKGNFELTDEERNFAEKNNIVEDVLLKQKQDAIEKLSSELNTKNNFGKNNLENSISQLNGTELQSPQIVKEKIAELKELASNYLLSQNGYDIETYQTAFAKQTSELEELGLSFESCTNLLNKEYENLQINIKLINKNFEQTKSKDQQKQRELGL